MFEVRVGGGGGGVGGGLGGVWGGVWGGGLLLQTLLGRKPRRIGGLGV